MGAYAPCIIIQIVYVTFVYHKRYESGSNDSTEQGNNGCMGQRQTDAWAR